MILDCTLTLGGTKLSGAIPSTGRRIWKDKDQYDVYDDIPIFLRDTISYKMPYIIEKLGSKMLFSGSVNSQYEIFLAQTISGPGKSYGNKSLEEIGFTKADANLNFNNKILEIWCIRVFEKFEIPQLLSWTGQHIVFVKQLPTTLCIATHANLKNVSLLAKKTIVGESVGENCTLEIIPPFLEETIFYRNKTEFHLKALENIAVYVVQYQQKRGYYPEELRSLGFQLQPESFVIKASLYNLEDVWHRILNKGVEIKIPRNTALHYYDPIIVIKKRS